MNPLRVPLGNRSRGQAGRTSINPGSEYTGHIVDEVEAIDPTLILSTGQSDDEGPIRTYDNPRLNAMRFNALQEALKRIEILETKVAALEAG